MRLPPDGIWKQTNNSDLFGFLHSTRNVSLNSEGYIKMSPRSVLLKSEQDEGNFGIPTSLGRYVSGSFLVATTDEPYEIEITTISFAATEDTGSSNPNMTVDSHGAWYNNLWFGSSATDVAHRTSASDTWTALSMSPALTSGVKHILTPFVNRRTLCVSNGNEVRQLNSDYSESTKLTIPTDYEIIGMAYNFGQLGIITRLGTDSAGQNQPSLFFVWSGATTEASIGISTGAGQALAVCPYLGSFAVLTNNGQLLLWTGGGFQVLDNFPFYYSDEVSNGLLSVNNYGTSMWADGDIIYINVASYLNEVGKLGERQMLDYPSGIWCFDPRAGLYHKTSPSISQGYMVTVADSGVNTTTNVMTRTTGTIPATGSIVRYTNNQGESIGGLTLYDDYYLIKTSSTTFKLATTKDNALNGVAIDLTSDGGSTHAFLMVDVIDYGATLYEKAGAISPMGDAGQVFKDLIFGGSFVHSNLSEYSDICINVPRLENRSYLYTAKIFSEGVVDTPQKFFVKFKPLRDSDAIVIKKKTRDFWGLPVSSPQNISNSGATWTGAREFYTSANLDRAVDALTANLDLEIMIVAGVGSGQAVKIVSIVEEDGVYSVLLNEDVIGAQSGLKSYYIIDNWKVFATIDANSEENDDGYVEVTPEGNYKWEQFQIEMRGINTTIENVDYVPSVFKTAT